MRRRLSRKGVSNIVAAVFLIAMILAIVGFLYATFQSLSDAVSSVTTQLAAINKAGRVYLIATSITVTSSGMSLSLANQGSSDVILTKYYVREYGTNQRWEGTLSEIVPAGGTASISIPGNFNSSASYLIVLISKDGGVYRFRYPPPTAGTGAGTGAYSLSYAPTIFNTYTVAAKGYNSSISNPTTYSDYTVVTGTLTATSPPTVSAELTTVYKFPNYSDWAYYKIINITENTGTDLVNYTVKIVLDTTNFDFTQANPDGSDIRFLGPDRTTLLNYWIQEWNVTNGTAIIWVKIPLLKGGENTTIYMLYGNPTATFDSDYYGLTKVMEPLPANDGPNYVIYYEPWVMNDSFFDPTQGILKNTWVGDDWCWAYSLPFSFPYYSSTYSTIGVCSDGYLNMTAATDGSSVPDSSISTFGNYNIIAPFWANLIIYGQGITGVYINSSYSDSYGYGILIRWRTAFSSVFWWIAVGEQNFTAILYRNGLIRFDYDNITGYGFWLNSDDTPVIGVSYGDGAHYTLLVSTNNEPASNWNNHRSIMLWPRKKATVEPSVAIYPVDTGSLSNAVQAYATSLIFYWRGYAPTTVINYSITLYINGPAATYDVTVKALTGVTGQLVNVTSTGPGLSLIEGVANVYFASDPVALMVNVSSDAQFSVEYRDATVTMSVLGDPLLAVAVNGSSTLYVLDIISSNWSQVVLPGKLVNPAIAFDYGRGAFMIVNGSSTLLYYPLNGRVEAGVSLPAPAGESAQVAVVGQYIVYAPGGGSRVIYVLRSGDGSVVTSLQSPAPIGPYSCSADDQGTGKVYVYVGGSGDLLVIDPAAATLTQLPMSPAPPTAYPVGMDYGGGYLWVIGRGGGIHYVDPSTGEVRAALTQLPYYPMSDGDRLAYFVISGSGYLYHVREDGTSEVWVIRVS